MSEKRWLIRTRSKQILGPASKEKIISLIEKNSLGEDDELTSGNGYWFWVREKDLVDKYLYEGSRQGFNPISEAETKLGPYKKKESALPPATTPVDAKGDEPVFPSDDDLAFPETITIEAKDLEVAKEDVDCIDSDNDLTASDIAVMVKPSSSDVNEECEVIEETEEEEEEEQDIELDASTSRPKINKNPNDRYLFVLLLVLVIALATVFYYYRTVLGKPIPIIGMSDAHAQGLDSLVKKKQLLS